MQNAGDVQRLHWLGFLRVRRTSGSMNAIEPNTTSGTRPAGSVEAERHPQPSDEFGVIGWSTVEFDASGSAVPPVLEVDGPAPAPCPAVPTEEPIIPPASGMTIGAPPDPFEPPLAARESEVELDESPAPSGATPAESRPIPASRVPREASAPASGRQAAQLPFEQHLDAQSSSFAHCSPTSASKRYGYT
jgi:hypothetical protein